MGTQGEETGRYLDIIDNSDDTLGIPIAVIGMGCRFPGGAINPYKYWKMLCDRVDAIADIPPNRWNADKFYDSESGVPGTAYTQRGGFLEDIYGFDAGFFGISPREAKRMDPHQRVLLEVAWEAAEDAGLAIDRKAPNSAGVFVGISNQDYTKVNSSLWEMDSINSYTATGISFSITANRISHALNLTGPSVALDTACSSSLVAVHLACKSLQNNECDIAFAGGVNLLLGPESFVSFCRLSMLSPDGCCKAFDARANGFVRSEGAGFVVLRPLKRAIESGDAIYAVIYESGINQDGRTPGITVPSEQAQIQLMRRVYQSTGILPKDIGYVEAHGTGTAVGDPIEARALGTIFGENRSDDEHCYIGSVKTNIGHLESAAGIAGLIKAVLSVHHGRIPPNLHFKTPNPDIDFHRLRLKVPTHLIPWTNNRQRLAAVNSFGFGGTNAHVVLGAFPDQHNHAENRNAEREGDFEIVCLSSHTADTLSEYANRLYEDIQNGHYSNIGLRDISRSANTKRVRQRYGLSLVSDSTRNLSRLLSIFSQGETAPGIQSDEALSPGSIYTAFIFSGQGPQWYAMGRQLMNSEPVFRDSILRCDGIFNRYASWSLLEELNRDEANTRLEQTAIAQPAIFSIQVALAALWRYWGIVPQAVVGHSVGEVAAAHVAGILSLEDAARVVFHRGRCMEFSRHMPGKMMAVGIPAGEITPYLQSYPGKVELAAINSPESITISGHSKALEEIEKSLIRREVFCRFLQVNYAFHSHFMEGMREKLLSSLKGLTTKPPGIKIISTVSGKEAEGEDFNREYWWRNVRQPVRFAAAMDCLIRDNANVFLELSPHPVLAGAVTECLSQEKHKAKIFPSLKRREPDRLTMLNALGGLYNLGHTVNWEHLYPERGKFVRLPQTAWSHEYYWHQTEMNQAFLQQPKEHPLLGARLSDPTPTYENHISERAISYLPDHRLHDHAVYPATAYLETALAVAQDAAGDAYPVLENIRLHKAFFLSPEKRIKLRTRFDRESLKFTIHGNDSGQTPPWQVFASGDILPNESIQEQPVSIAEIRNRCVLFYDETRCYEHYRKTGLLYGDSFQGLRGIYCGEGEAIGEVVAPACIEPDLNRYSFHPAMLDACLQVIIGAAGFRTHSGYLPVYFRRVHILNRPSSRMWSHTKNVVIQNGTLEASVEVFDQSGNLIIRIDNIQCRNMELDGKDKSSALNEVFYGYRWESRTSRSDPETSQDPGKAATAEVENSMNPGLSAASLNPESSGCIGKSSPLLKTEGQWIVFNDDHNMGQKLARLIHLAGGRCRLVTPGNGFKCLPERESNADPGQGKGSHRFASSISEESRMLPIDGVVYFWGLNATNDLPRKADDFEEVFDRISTDILNIVGEFYRNETKQLPRLWLITRGVHHIEGETEPVSVFQGALWGLGRVIRNELPGLNCTMVDLDPDSVRDSDASIQLLFETLTRDEKETEIAFRKNGIYHHRLLKQPLKKTVSISSQSQEGFRLEIDYPGSFEQLHLCRTARKPPRQDEVEIQVRAAGLNFSDVMKSLNLYPGLSDGPVPLGIECAGQVRDVGKDVMGFKPGDPVLALAPFSFSDTVLTSEKLVKPAPVNLSHEACATIPLAFLTAYYALVHLADLQPGERVLIHSATGGVGLAAIQIARHLGADIIATAGSQEKRDHLKTLGINAAMDSRSLAFAEEVRRLTRGKGVDVVLNSLTGEAIPKSLSVLCDYGRFLELGKTDIYQDKKIGLMPFRKNLSYFAIDLDKVLREKKALVSRLMDDIMKGFSAGYYAPLPFKTVPIQSAADGFRTMAKAKHIGKIVLTVEDHPLTVSPSFESAVTFKDNATYLITGAFGGFGLLLMDWLVKHGARHLALMSRSGPQDENVKNRLNSLKMRGVDARIFKGDVSVENDIKRMMENIQHTMPPLKGIFHTAVVLDDGLLTDLTPERMRTVMNPKIKGAWYLHQHTNNLSLDVFVLFSSMSSIIGLPGQGNYAAANAFLDAFSHYRRRLGLPSITINWGYLGKVGVAARNQTIVNRFQNMGIQPFEPEQALQLLSRILIFNPVQTAPVNVDWNRFNHAFQGFTESPVFSKLGHMLHLQPVDGASDHRPYRDIHTLLDGATRKERTEALIDALKTQTARILGTQTIDIEVPLTELGFDSLMAVELRNWAESRLGAKLPTMEIMSGPSVQELAKKLMVTIDNPDSTADQDKGRLPATGTHDPMDGIPEDILESIDSLSEEAVDDMLAALQKGNDG